MTPEQRFWAKVRYGGTTPATADCWEWTGARTAREWHGIFLADASRAHRQSVVAHRFSWELANGPIPDGLLVLHHCDNPPCIRPDHLFLGTQLDNMRDAEAKGRSGPQVMARKDWSICKRGHKIEGENLYRHPSTGRRMCRTCHHRRAAEWRASHQPSEAQDRAAVERLAEAIG